MFKASNLPPGCPPLNAIEKDVQGVYRLVNSPPNDKDFETHVEGDLPFDEELICYANSLSFFTTLKRAQEISIRFKKFKKPNIHFYHGNLLTSFGQQTEKKKHISLWVYKGVEIKKEFLKVGTFIGNP